MRFFSLPLGIGPNDRGRFWMVIWATMYWNVPVFEPTSPVFLGECVTHWATEADIFIQQKFDKDPLMRWDQKKRESSKLGRGRNTLCCRSAGIWQLVEACSIQLVRPWQHHSFLGWIDEKLIVYSHEWDCWTSLRITNGEAVSNL